MMPADVKANKNNNKKKIWWLYLKIFIRSNFKIRNAM